MDLAADIEKRLGRIFTIVEHIEEDRLDVMPRTNGKPCQKLTQPNSGQLHFLCWA